MEIKNAVFCDNLEICLEHNNNIIFLVQFHCDDATICLKGRVKNASYVSEDIKCETGEKVPIDEIIDWFESKAFVVC